MSTYYRQAMANQDYRDSREHPGRTVVFLRVARSGLLFSLIALAIAMMLRSASFLIVGLGALAYTLLLCAVLTAEYNRLLVMTDLRHNVVTVRQPNMLTWKTSSYTTTLPVLISIDPVFPSYVVPHHQRTSGDTLTVFFNAARKGVYTVGGARITLQDPLRIFRIQYVLAPRLSLTVIPRALPLTSLHIALTSPLDGQRVRYAPNVDTSQLAGTHSYDGEPMNRIHWKMSAHTGSLLVKDFTPSASQTAVLVVDYTVSGDFSFMLETLDETLSAVATSILTYIHDRRLPFAVATLGAQTDWVAPGHDRTRLLACLTAIARAQTVKTASGNTLLDWLNHNMHTFPARSQLFIIAHTVNEDGIVELLRRRESFARVTVIVFPEGSFLLPGEHRAPYYLKDSERLTRLRSLQRVLGQNGIDLQIVELNDAFTTSRFCAQETWTPRARLVS